MTNRTAATRYARALLDVGVKEQVDVQAIERQLAEFADLLAKHPQLHEALLNPAIPVQRKRATVEEALRRVVDRHRRKRALDDLKGIGWEGDLDAMRRDWSD